jgi:ABC-type polysaccharide/polyol phosphate transport system ATPase subunit
VAERPVVVEVEDLHKAFRLPKHRVDTLKERALHPFTPIEYTALHALRGISFRVAEGELLGIAGRNGSGKTTLLKLIASIYRADRGRIRIAGNLAPFIELGVGFNPSFTARENVLLNGVMMGLTPKEARRRFDQVIDFAELGEFVEMKLKNYSTGMALRLAFALMVQSDADVMLIDEVLAVGDASFAQKCMDALQGFRDEGRTILLVTHDTESLQRLCDRAILIQDGVIDIAGDPDDVAHRYLEINFAGDAEPLPAAGDGAGTARRARIADVWLEDSEGGRPRGFAHGAPLHLIAVLEAAEEIDRPGFGFEICSTDGTRVFATPVPPASVGGEDDRLQAGERITVRATVANPLTPGSYTINCSLSQHDNGFDVVHLREPALEFVVWGTRRTAGYVELDWDCEVEREPRTGAIRAGRE